MMEEALLAHDEPPAFRVRRASGTSPFLLICDHAGNRIPRRLNSLGLDDSELQRHIAWDIGAAGASALLSEALDATLILQTYSRLVIDCNRPLSSPDSIAALSERTSIPGNQFVPAGDAERRASEVFWPYHERIRQELDARAERGQLTVLISMHSFTPIFKDEARPWHAGVLYNRDARLAQALMHALRLEPGLVIGDNQPYDLSDESDYSVPEYGERRGLAHVELEIRQDLISDDAGQHEWAMRLARLLPLLIEQLDGPKQASAALR